MAFRPLASGDLGLLHGWLQQPHVRAFWDGGDRAPGQVRAHYFPTAGDATARFAVTLDGRAAGYFQAYPVGPDSEYARWRRAPGETWGLDLLLGEPGDIGRGHGPRVLRAFAGLWQAEHAHLRRLFVDPDVRHARAVRAYQNAGFVPVGAHRGHGITHTLLALDL